MSSPGKQIRFVLCIEDGGAPDLEKGKVYRMLSDPDAKRSGMVRVVDDSREDYLYPRAYFVPLDLPTEAKKALLA